MRGALVLITVAGCYGAHPAPGSPCDGTDPCPAGLVCSPATLTCELTIADAPVSILDVMPDVRLIDGCTPVPEVCGDGIDQNCDGTDPACAANDDGGGAIDVSAGGTFTADLAAAHDDAPNDGCNGDGGRDLFYKLTLPAPEVIYVDTFGSSFGTIVRVYAGHDCMGLGNAAAPSCDAGACGGLQSQIARTLPAGTSCIVIDQHAGDTSGMLALHVKRGGRDGKPLASGMKTNTGTSCSGVNATQPNNACVSGDSKTSEDVAYYFTACPAQMLLLDASTCTDPTMTHFDTVVYARPVGGGTLQCQDDNAACLARPDRSDGQPDGSVLTDVPAMGPNMFWLTVDGFGGACGVYRLDTNLR